LAQSHELKGRIVDQDNKQPLPSVIVTITALSDSKNSVSVSTDAEGYFVIKALKQNERYRLKTSLMSFNPLDIAVDIKTKNIDLGTLSMLAKDNEIDEIVINMTPPTAKQNGDTLEINANAFKTTRDASAEELVKKMPGISVENNNVKANGQDVKRILIDGKDFFGEDPSVALKNLPAEIIEKIQIFDKLSEQAQFTGFDDGMSDKAINIITRKDRQNGQFGKVYAGSDFNDKYLAGGNYNNFSKHSRFSVIGLLNDVNQQNFAQQDMLSIPSSGKGKGEGGFSVNQQNGINTTRSIGMNFITDWGSKFNFTGSYFFNSNDNDTKQLILKDKFLSPRSDHFSNTKDTLETNKLTHRLHLRFEYLLDSMNSIIATPVLTFQQNKSSEILSKLTTKDAGVFVNATDYENRSGVNGYNLENELVLKHKFDKSKRTISIALTTAANNRDPFNTQVGTVEKSANSILSTNQNSTGTTNNYKLGSSIVYIEPLGDVSMLHFSLKSAYSNSNRIRNIKDVDDNFKVLNPIDSLSNNFNSNYFNNHFGLSYRIKSKSLKFSIGMEYQYAKLNDRQISPKILDVNSSFKNLLPEVQLTIKNPKSALQLLYKTSTDAPSISQLQNQIDNSDKTGISTGNPYLKQQYIHDLTCKYSFANPENSFYYTIYLSGDYKQNYIGTQTITAAHDSLLTDVGVLLQKNMDLTRPVNMDHYANLKSVFSFSFPAKMIKSKLNLSVGAAYTQTPAYINQTLNRYSLYSLNNGIALSSDWGENIDFSLSYNLNYSLVRNSITTSLINQNNNPNFTTQSIGTKVTWVFLDGFVLQADLSYQKERGFLNYNQDYALVNMSLGRKIFKNKSGEIKFGVFDAQNNNINFTHAVTPQSLVDSKIVSLTRYYMLSFTYTLRAYEAPKTSKKGKKNKKKTKENED